MLTLYLDKQAPELFPRLRLANGIRTIMLMSEGHGSSDMRSLVGSIHDLDRTLMIELDSDARQNHLRAYVC